MSITAQSITSTAVPTVVKGMFFLNPNLYVLGVNAGSATINSYTINGRSPATGPTNITITNAAALSGATSIAVTATTIFISTSATPGIYSIPIAGNQLATVITGSPATIKFLDIQNNYLYGFATGILYYALSTSVPSSFTQIAIATMDNPSPCVTFDNSNNNLYYIKNGGATVDIYFPGGTGAYNTTPQSITLSSVISTPGGMAYNGNTFYIADAISGRGVYTYAFPLTGANPTLVTGTSTSSFLSNDQNNNVLAYRTTPSELLILLPPPPPTPSGSGAACFLKGTFILTNNGYRLIEELKKGDLVNTFKNGFVSIDMISKEDVQPTDSCKLYKLSYPQYPHLWKDLYLTGSHSVLVGDLREDQRKQIVKDYNQVFVTDGYYRLPIYLDEKAIQQEDGEYTVYHIVLEHENIQMNYGIYANGLLVESANKYDIIKSSMVTN